MIESNEAAVASAAGNGAAVPVTDAPIALPGVGDRLRAAREARNLSVADVAQAIKIAPRVIQQVEGNAWNQLAGHTFARGVVRSYARLVHIDAEELLRELENAPLPKPPLLELPRSTQAALPVPGQAQKRDRVAMAGGVVLVALAVVAYFLIPDDWLGAPAPAKERAAVAAALPVVPAAAPSPAPAPQPAAGETAANSAVAPSGAAAVPPPVAVAAPVVQLVLRFDEASWAEIRDRSGAILISENVAAGGERQLGGEAPYNIWLGNADGVRLSYRGQNVDLKPHTRQKVARLSLE